MTKLCNSPMVSICVDLESCFSVVSVMAEQFLQGNNSSNSKGHLTGDQRLSSNGC